MTGEIKTERRVGDDGEWIITLRYFIDREEVTEKAYRKAIPEKAGVPMFATAISEANPWKSDGLACHSSQVPAIIARNKARGLNIPYDRMGRPICTSAAQRKKLLKIERVHQLNSYYGA